MKEKITRQDVSDAVFNAFEKHVEHVIKPFDTFYDLGLDSLDRVELEMDVEATLECREDLESIFISLDNNATIDELIDKICKRLGI